MSWVGNSQNAFYFQYTLHLQKMEVDHHTLSFLLFCTFRSCEHIHQVVPIFPTLHLLRMKYDVCGLD